MAEVANRPVFELYDVGLVDGGPEAIGPWETVPSASAARLAFGTPTAAGRHAPVWRINLPTDRDLAVAHLGGGEARLQAYREGLATAANRLQVFVGAQQAGLAFGITPAATELAQPEAQLMSLLRARQAGRTAASFGLGESLAGEWERATEQCQTSLNRLVLLVSHFAWVETREQEHLLGRTAVDWTGDLDTVWQAGLSPVQVAFHQRALDLALASRDTLMRMVALAARGAVSLSVLLATPGGAVLALPAVWRFINQVLAEIEERHGQEEAPRG